MRKCRNWQTSKTKDLVINAIVWVQVPSSAVGKSLEIKGFFLFHKKVASVYKGPCCPLYTDANHSGNQKET